MRPVERESILAEIETARLQLMALGIPHLRLYLSDPQRFGQVIGFPVSEAVLTSVVRRAITVKMARMDQVAKTQHRWYTYWLVVVAGHPYGAGLIGFKGAPNRQGEVEIGYGIDPNWQNRGYMTEAVRAMIRWAFRQPESISAVIAETARTNAASQRVLTKVGLSVYRETADFLYWRMDKTRL